MMKRVLQIGLSYDQGGIESFVMNYYKHIDKDKIQFDFINPYDRPLAYEKEIYNLGGEIYRIADFHKSPYKYKKQLLNIVQSYDTVHIHILSAANIIPLNVAKHLNIPKIIVHSHNAGTKGLHRKILHILNYRKIQEIATSLFACSNKAGDWMFGKNTNYKVVPNAIDRGKFAYNISYREELRENLHIETNAIVYGFVGRLAYQKNPIFLIRVFSEIIKQQSNSYLCLVGDGELREDMAKLSQDLGIEKRIFFLGRRNDVHKLYSMMDAMIMPSLFEGLPITLVEAQANGLKCFISKNITNEIKIIDSLDFLDLKEGPSFWAKHIINSDILRDENAGEMIIQAHYDIEKEVLRLENEYLNI